MDINYIKFMCDELNIENYDISPDGFVNCNSSIDISEKKLTEIPIKFGEVMGDFVCCDNNLTSLENIPYRCDNIICHNNNLKYLEIENCYDNIIHDIDIYSIISYNFIDNYKMYITPIDDDTIKYINRINKLKKIFRNE